jgi:hypothetical protein
MLSRTCDMCGDSGKEISVETHTSCGYEGTDHHGRCYDLCKRCHINLIDNFLRKKDRLNEILESFKDKDKNKDSLQVRNDFLYRNCLHREFGREVKEIMDKKGVRGLGWCW